MKIKQLMPVALFFLLGTLPAAADDWGRWEPFGTTGISIRFAQVRQNMCTWAFRNDSSRTLKAMSFRIDNVDNATGRAEHSSDLIPYSLRPGQSVGGWTAFSASGSCSNVRITTKDIEWQ